MLFNLLLLNGIILLCFFGVVVIIFFRVPVTIKNAKLKLAIAIPTGALIIVSNNAIEVPSSVAENQLNTYQSSQKKQYVY